MDKQEMALSIAKTGLGLITSIGATALCGAFASKIVGESNMKNTEKFCAGIAGAVIGGMLGDKASEYVDTTIDQIVKTVRTVRDIFQQIKKEDKAE